MKLLHCIAQGTKELIFALILCYFAARIWPLFQLVRRLQTLQLCSEILIQRASPIDSCSLAGTQLCAELVWTVFMEEAQFCNDACELIQERSAALILFGKLG